MKTSADNFQELEIDFPGPGQEVVWPPPFEYHLKGKTFLDEAAQKIQQDPPIPCATCSTPAFNGPERPEDLKSRYYNVKGWDDE